MGGAATGVVASVGGMTVGSVLAVPAVVGAAGWAAYYAAHHLGK